MSNSAGQRVDVTCSRCRRDFADDIWLIVDVQERPDLLARLRTGVLHDLNCPHCGQTTTLDTPILVYRPNAAPHLVYSPAQETEAEQDREQAGALLRELAGSLGGAWQDAWLPEAPSVPRPLLPAALDPDPEAALRRMAGGIKQPRRTAAADAATTEVDSQALEPPSLQTLLAELAAQGIAVESRADLERLLEQRPELRTRFAAAMQQALPPLVGTLDRFLRAATWPDSRAVLAQHPELLDDEVDTLIGQLMDAARAQGDQKAVSLFDEHRRLLQRCREIGIEAAFRETLL